MTISEDYLERVYAGVLGKLIGVYLGRPFEQWTHQRIMQELGPIEYYVHERLGQPLVVTDDDVAGTFTFVRALEDYGITPELSARDIGRAWLNYIVEDRSILWWGGNGNSTEHTAWLNLRKGIPSPDSGSVATNGATLAEQIGAQIFIDGWAMVAPCQPRLAAQLAQRAASVSHDGEAVHAAMLWAAMEAEGFRSADIDHLLDVGLREIPADCLIARLIDHVRGWHRANPDWMATRQLIEDRYGYAKYLGNCHVVPNHALMIMAVLYAPDNFQRAQMIVNTSGWDTDCNAGNVGCLQGIMLGLEGLDAGPDWRGPIADRMLISSADGGNSINDAVRTAYYLAALGCTLAGEDPVVPPKSGAQFHFSLPGSQQGFRAQPLQGRPVLEIRNTAFEQGRAISLRYRALAPGMAAALTTPTFTPPEVLNMRTYELLATPLVYPGQMLRARVVAAAGNAGAVSVRLRLRVYGGNDELRDVDGDPTDLVAGAECVLEWRLPDLDGQPIAEVGIVLAVTGQRADGELFLDYLRWDGPPEFVLRRPRDHGNFWHMAWVNGTSVFSKQFPQSFRISQASGVGIIVHGTRQWSDYTVAADITLHLGLHGGVAVRVQGLRRYYIARIIRAGRFQIVRVRDEDETILADTPFATELERKVTVTVSTRGRRIKACADNVTLVAEDLSGAALTNGGIGLVVCEGALSTDEIRIGRVVETYDSPS